MSQRLQLARRWLWPEDISNLARGQHRPELNEEKEALRACVREGDGLGLVDEHLGEWTGCDHESPWGRCQGCNMQLTVLELVEQRFELIRREIAKYMAHLDVRPLMPWLAGWSTLTYSGQCGELVRAHEQDVRSAGTMAAGLGCAIARIRAVSAAKLDFPPLCAASETCGKRSQEL